MTRRRNKRKREKGKAGTTKARLLIYIDGITLQETRIIEERRENDDQSINSLSGIHVMTVAGDISNKLASVAGAWWSDQVGPSLRSDQVCKP